MGVGLWLLRGSAGYFISLGLSFFRCVDEDKSSIHSFIHLSHTHLFQHLSMYYCHSA